MNSLLAAAVISCSYSFMGAPFTTVAFSQYDDGTISSSAEITPTGGAKAQKEPLTQVAAAPDELIHAWISKDDKDNSLELIVYKEKQANGRSKMINPHIPFGNEMWGDCSGL